MSELVVDGAVEARANVNIALIKYWGKAPSDHPADANLPAVPSLSLTLDGLYTITRVRFAPEAEADRVMLNGQVLDPQSTARARIVLDRVRTLADVAAPFLVESVNHVPTAAGLASSASSMAALAAAAARCAGLDLAPEALSAVARVGSGSASRSVFGGWAAWEGPQAWQVDARQPFVGLPQRRYQRLGAAGDGHLLGRHAHGRLHVGQHVFVARSRQLLDQFLELAALQSTLGHPALEHTMARAFWASARACSRLAFA